MASDGSTVHLASKVVVTTVFAMLGLAFIAESALFWQEFATPAVDPNQPGVEPADLRSAIGAIYAQNYLFFPIAGLAALIGFWRPACLAFDAYARGFVRGGRAILTLGLFTAIAVTVAMAIDFANSDTRSLFEVSPDALRADQGGFEGLEEGGSVRLAPVSQIVNEVRAQARAEGGLSLYTDRCVTERTTSNRPTPQSEARYCFVTDERDMSNEACCAAKAAFTRKINRMHSESPSLSAQLHRVVMPLKIFFLLILLGIGLMLIRRGGTISALYGGAMKRFALAAPVGAGLMLLWPLMNSAHAQAYDLLFGSEAASSYRINAPIYALVFVIWALFLLFFFVRETRPKLELMAQSIGLVGAAIGIVQYDAIRDYVSQTLGAGSTIVSIAIFCAAVVFVTNLMLTWGRVQARRQDAGDA